LSYNQPFPKNLPQSLKLIHFAWYCNQLLQENLLKSLSIILFNEKHKNANFGKIYSCVSNLLCKNGMDLEIAIKREPPFKKHINKKQIIFKNQSRFPKQQIKNQIKQLIFQ